MISKEELIKLFEKFINNGEFGKSEERYLYQSFVDTLSDVNDVIIDSDYKIIQITNEKLEKTKFEIENKVPIERKSRLFNLLFFAEEPFHHLRFSAYNGKVEFELLDEVNDDCKTINNWFKLVILGFLKWKNDDWVVTKLKELSEEGE